MSDPYLIRGTDTLRNRLGITDPGALIRAEADLTVARMVQLEEGLQIPGRWDLDHLRAFHRHIFQDIYDWAGEIRTVDISKSDHVFARPQFIEAAATELFAELAGADNLRGRDRVSFIEGVTHVLAEINALHPFREGNGRAQRAFVGAQRRRPDTRSTGVASSRSATSLYLRRALAATMSRCGKCWTS